MLFLFRKHVEETNKPKREVKQLDRVVQNFKPKATHAFLVSLKGPIPSILVVHFTS